MVTHQLTQQAKMTRSDFGHAGPSYQGTCVLGGDKQLV